MEDISEDEVEQTWRALRALPRSSPMSHITTALYKDDIKQAISSGLLVPPPKTQMERDREEWLRVCVSRRDWKRNDIIILHDIIARLFRAAEAAKVRY